jgi:hypothetical protein
MVAYDMFYSYVNGDEERVNNSSDGSESFAPLTVLTVLTLIVWVSGSLCPLCYTVLTVITAYGVLYSKVNITPLEDLC